MILPDGGHPAPVFSQVDPGPDRKREAGEGEEETGKGKPDPIRYDPLRQEVGREPVKQENPESDPDDPVHEKREPGLLPFHRRTSLPRGDEPEYIEPRPDDNEK